MSQNCLKMINGKFYTGLTNNMMNRTRGPDRQKSNFFWPTENENAPSEKSSGRRSQQQINNNNQRNGSDVPEHSIKPKELFHKQLKSKIEFYDTVDLAESPQQVTPKQSNESYPPIKQLTKRSNNNTMRNDQSLNNNNNRNVVQSPDTFTSKIEFYDFAKDKPEVTVATPIKSAVSGEKKKITFHQITSTGQNQKGILKNSPKPESVRNIPVIEEFKNYKKNTVPRRNLSKSVENISIKADCYEEETKPNGTVTKEVNAIQEEYSIPTEKAKTQRHDEYYAHEERRNNFKEPTTIKQAPKLIRNDYGYDDIDRNGYREPSQTYNNSRERKQLSQHDDRHYRSERTNYSYDNNNTRYHNVESYSDGQPPIEVIKKPIIPAPRNNDFDRQIDRRNSKNTTYYESETNSRLHQTPQKQYGSPTSNKSYPNEARGRAHTHLRSNIFFNDDSSYHEEQPRSIRSSAVCRVGVGLPNI